MMVIGLTGGIASGKSTVAAMLHKANIPVVDADELARVATKPGSPIIKTLTHIFGNDIIGSDGSLDRKKLGEIVFDDEHLRKKLEGILHPEIKRLAHERLSELEQSGHDVAVYMAPLIFETNLHKELTKTLLITADRNTTLTRAQSRDHLSKSHIEKRMKAQYDDATKARMADVVINNDGSLKDLHEKLSRAWKTLTGMSLASTACDEK